MPCKILEHTADVRLFVQEKSMEKFFSDAVLGMMKILNPQKADSEHDIQKAVKLKAQDTTSLLVDFLNEVLLSANINKEAYNRVEFKNLSENSIDVVLRGFPVKSFGEDIKAVTYHEANVQKNEKGEWETTLVFDI